MAINEAYFWLSITVFGTGLYFMVDHHVFGGVITLLGLVGMAHSVYVHHAEEVKIKFGSVDWSLWTRRISLIFQIVLMLTFTATVIIGYYTYRKTSVARDAFARSGISSQLPGTSVPTVK